MDQEGFEDEEWKREEKRTSLSPRRTRDKGTVGREDMERKLVIPLELERRLGVRETDCHESGEGGKKRR